MTEKLSPAGTLLRLRQARSELLNSQVAVLDLAKLSATEAALLDFPEQRAKRLADSVGLTELELEKSMALFAAVDALSHETDENRKKREASDAHDDSTTDGAAQHTQDDQSRQPVDEPGEDDTPTAMNVLVGKISEIGLPQHAVLNVIISWAKISGEKSRSGLMLEALLISAVAQFEVFVSRLISISLRFDPSALTDSDRKFTFSDVSSHESLGSFISAAAGTYVDSLMYDGMGAWMKFLAKATRSDTAWVSDLLAEVVMRRNVHVHAGGRASAQYLSALGKNAAAVQVGDNLPVTEPYLEDALNRMARATIVLSQSAIAAVCAVNKTKDSTADLEPDSGVVEASFDLLAAGRFQAVAPLADQLLVMVTKNTTKERLRVNSMWAQKKWLGDESVRAEIEAWDVSSSEDELKLAKYCLLGEKEAALKLYRRLEESKTLTAMELAIWPILEVVRVALAEEAAAE